MNKGITELFNQFAGKEVPMVETQRTTTIGGETYTFDNVDLANPNDPTIQEMEKVAKDNNIRLRIILPGRAYTADYDLSRVNAAIVKEADGKWRVSSQFGLG